MVDGFELLQGLAAGDGVDQDEGVTFGDGEPLHGGELVTSCRVSDLQRADALVAADHLRRRQTSTSFRSQSGSAVQFLHVFILFSQIFFGQT